MMLRALSRLQPAGLLLLLLSGVHLLGQAGLYVSGSPPIVELGRSAHARLPGELARRLEQLESPEPSPLGGP